MNQPIAETCSYDPATGRCKPKGYPMLAHEMYSLLAIMELVRPIRRFPPYTHLARVGRQFYLVKHR